MLVCTLRRRRSLSTIMEFPVRSTMRALLQRRGIRIAVVVVLALTNLSLFIRVDENPMIRLLFPRNDDAMDSAAHVQGPTTTTEEEPERNVKVVTWEGWFRMEKLIQAYWDGNLFCKVIDTTRRKDPSALIRFNITFGCHELFKRSSCGTGNFLGLYYGLRLAAHVYDNVEVHFTCYDAEEMRNHLILPWLTGVFPARRPHQPSAFDLTPGDVCGGAYQQPLGHVLPSIQNDLRRMAVALVGHTPPPSSSSFMEPPPFDTPQPPFLPHLSRNNNNPAPPYADVELDEAVLHFRCGDLMDSNHSSFAFMNFRGYTRHIGPNATSIGILTQPFAATTASQVRRIDSESHLRDRCRTVVQALVEYCQERFPQARVRIHNSEPIALTYARMILAKQAISGISTFGVMPTAATFGTGYIRVPDHPIEVNQWVLLPRIDELVNNIVLIEDPKMPVQRIQTLWEQEGEEGVLAWFRNDSWTAEEG